MQLRTFAMDDLEIEDERSFRHVAIYEQLKSALRRDDFRFRGLPRDDERATWDRALFLNLTFWSAGEPSDVLVDETVPADVIAHAAWHHLARRAFAGRMSADALFFGEAVASAFDLYLVGRLLGHANESTFLETQVPAMADVALQAGVSEEAFEALIESVASDPERAFEDLRELLFDAGTTLVRASSVDEAARAFEALGSHRFGALLHHYELSNWILYARAYAGDRLEPDAEIRALDAELRSAPVALSLLEKRWLGPLP